MHVWNLELFMNKIVTKQVNKNSTKRIALLFEYNKEIIEQVKLIKDRKWSTSEKFWHIPYQDDYLQILNEKFIGKLVFIENTTKKTEPEKPSKIIFHLSTSKL